MNICETSCADPSLRRWDYSRDIWQPWPACGSRCKLGGEGVIKAFHKGECVFRRFCCSEKFVIFNFGNRLTTHINRSLGEVARASPCRCTSGHRARVSRPALCATCRDNSCVFRDITTDMAMTRVPWKRCHLSVCTRPVRRISKFLRKFKRCFFHVLHLS